MTETLTNEFNRNDRDMLIRLDTKMDQMILDVKDLKDGTAIKIANLKECVDKHEKWISEQKMNVKWMIGITTAVSSIVTFIISQLLSIGDLIEKTH
jgi:hypothetical protein